MSITTWANDWLSKKTFWQISLAVGLSVMTGFTIGFVAPHALMYQIQHALKNLADPVGLDSNFDLVMMCLYFTGIFLAIRYTKLAQILRINRLILCLILVVNIGCCYALKITQIN